MIESKQRPRKLAVVGSDGRHYAFLLKGHEDLRQDKRVMQLFGLVNTLLASAGDDLDAQSFLASAAAANANAGAGAGATTNGGGVAAVNAGTGGSGPGGFGGFGGAGASSAGSLVAHAHGLFGSGWRQSQHRQRDLSIRGYSVIPLAPTAGLIQWLSNCDTLHALIKEYREARRILLSVEHKLMLGMAPDFLSLTPMQKVEAFEHALAHTTGRDLYEVLWLKSPNSEAWVTRRYGPQRERWAGSGERGTGSFLCILGMYRGISLDCWILLSLKRVHRSLVNVRARARDAGPTTRVRWR